MREKASVYNIEEAMSKFERYQQKIDRVEAQVEAYDFMQKSESGQSLHAQFEALEKDESVERELKKKKKAVSA